MEGLPRGGRRAAVEVAPQRKDRRGKAAVVAATAEGRGEERLEAVIKARNAATTAREHAVADPGNAAAMSELSNADSGLGGVLGRLFALSEAYPDLRSNENMLQLQEELTSTESKVAFARQAYNDAVMHFNNKLEMFPSNFVANIFNFVPATMFEVSDDSERDAVKVEF